MDIPQVTTLADVVWNPLMEARRVWKREEEVCQCNRNTHLFSKCARCIQQEEEARVREQSDMQADPEAPEAEEAAMEAAGDVEPAVKVAEPAEEKAEASLQERVPFFRW